MFAITGITGQVGGAVARELLAGGERVRAVVRDAAKGEAWRKLGCEVAIADVGDAAALTHALRDCSGAFLLLPPTFDPSPDFAESARTIAAMKAALTEARPGRVLLLSTIGAQAKHRNLLSQLGMLENAMQDLTLPVTVLRPGWFIENLAWDIPAARERGEIDSLLQPLDRAIPMVATADVGRTAAALLLEASPGHRLVELEGAQRVSPNDLADALARALGRSVKAVAIPRGQWEARFRAQGMRNPEPRIRMLDGFNEGWIAFKGEARKGVVSLDEVVAELLARS